MYKTLSMSVFPAHSPKPCSWTVSGSLPCGDSGTQASSMLGSTALRAFVVCRSGKIAQRDTAASLGSLLVRGTCQTSLVVQWPGLYAPSAGGLSSVPGQGAGSQTCCNWRVSRTMMRTEGSMFCSWDLAWPNK